MPYLPPLQPPPPPEPPAPPPRRRGRWLLNAIVPAVIGAATALGVAALADDEPSSTAAVVTVSTPAPPSSTTREPDVVEPAPAVPPRTDGAPNVQEIVRQASSGVVLVEQRTGLGTGFLIDAEGRILTNAHVVDDATTVQVTYSDGTQQDAKVLAADDTIDLAVLDVDVPPSSARPLALGQSRTLTVGDPVIAIGNPLGYERTATTGIVSAVKRQICSPNQSAIANAIQTDAAINQGNSGGPLLDGQGRVIGINSQIVSQGGGFEGIGFAVPIDTVRPVADSIIATGSPKHSWIGIIGEPMTPELAKELGVPGTAGVALRTIDARGPSKAAGLRGSSAAEDDPPKGGDIIIEFAGRPVRDFGDLSQEIASRAVGTKVDITVLRDGKRVTLPLTLADRPGDLGGTCQ